MTSMVADNKSGVVSAIGKDGMQEVVVREVETAALLVELPSMDATCTIEVVAACSGACAKAACDVEAT